MCIVDFAKTAETFEESQEAARTWRKADLVRAACRPWYGSVSHSGVARSHVLSI